MSTSDKQQGASAGNTPAGARNKSPDRIERPPVDQGGHAGAGAHGGQHSGGMGGEHGGDLHNIGSAQSGMTGRAGMGGNEQKSGQGASQKAGPGERQAGGGHSYDDYAEVQQSIQREGMGKHRHSGRGNEQALDVDDDVDSVGTHHGSAGRSHTEGPDS